MNDLDRAIVATLQAEASEASMRTDTPGELDRLDERLDGVDRTRRRWQWGAAAAAVAVAAAVVAFVVMGRPTAAPAPPITSPTPSSPSPTIPFRAVTTSMTPNLTADLPYWAALATSGGQGVGYANYDQADCGTSACPSDGQRKIKMLTVVQMYRLQDGPRITRNPSYAVDLAAWEAIPSLGYGTVSDRTTTKVDGRPAVVLTVSATKDMPGLAACDSPSAPAVDCFAPQKDRTYRIAIVDQGPGEPPTLLWESTNADDPALDDVLAEFDTWLATVRFD